jgi:hypothetical protein
LLLWDEVKKIKQEEKRKIIDAYEMMMSNQNNTMNPASRELLKLKELKRQEAHQEPRFDNGESMISS